MTTLSIAVWSLLCLHARPPLAVPHATFAADIPIKAPEGWKSSKNSGATVLTPGDLAAGKVYTVIVTPLQVKAGSLDEVYETAKKMMVEAGTYKPASDPRDQRSTGGWDYRVSIGTVEKDGKALLAEVVALKKADDGGVVIVLADSLDTLQNYSDAFTLMIRGLGGADPDPVPASPPSGAVDLQYAVPAGWTETKKDGANVIEVSKEDFYTSYRWTLVVMPTQALAGSIHDNFAEYWKSLVTANYDSDVVPLPLTASLGDGHFCAFDAESRAKHKTSGAKPRVVGVYLIVHGDRFVPILAVIYGYDKQVDADFNKLIQSARIPGTSEAKAPMFSTADLVGNWSEGSSSIASYVTASGGYAGDASIYTGSYFNLQADGSYDHTLIALSGATRIKEKDAGTWSIDNNELVTKHSKGTNRYSLLGYGLDAKAGRFLVLGVYANIKAKLSFSAPRDSFTASWYKAK